MKHFYKLLGVYSILLFQTCFSQEYPDEIIFYSNGSTFSPLISIQGDATILWTFDDSTTSSLASPTKDYGTELLRKNRLKVTPWNALKGINIGYDGSDGGSDSITFLSSQKVSKVEHLSLAAPYLEFWCSSYNLMDSLNFDNFINLETIECYKCTKVQNISLKNTPKLKRLCVEDNDLKSLDISECTGLEDLRAAINEYDKITFSNSTEEMWHLCVRDNPKIEDSLLFSNLDVFPAISELWIWNCSQSGAFKLQTTITDEISIVAHDNKYSTLNLSGALQKETSWAQVYFENNELESVNVSGCKQIYKLNLRNNRLLPDSVDKVLSQMDELGEVKYTDYRFVDLRDNSIPTDIGLIHKANLEARGWTIYVQTGCVINVSGNGVSITNGDITPDDSDFTDFDSVKVNSDSIIHTFIIKNSGTTPLELFRDTTIILIGGINATNFIVISEPDSLIAVGDSTSFQIAFAPSEIGLLTATVSISHDDWDNNPFTFNIQGTGVTLTNLEEISSIPVNFGLSQNYPNPFNPYTIISYQIPITAKVILKVYNLLGVEVATLVNEYKSAGRYEINLNANQLSNGKAGLTSGTYLYRLQAGKFVEAKKMILLK